MYKPHGNCVEIGNINGIEIDIPENDEVRMDLLRGQDGKDAHSPYAGENGNWWEWNDDAGAYVDSGKPWRAGGGATGSGLPNGGKAGQYLRKKSDADGDVEWADIEIPKEYGLVTYDQNKTITIR